MTERGLYDKYLVFYQNCEEVTGFHFVLAPEKDLAAREALVTYAVCTDNEALREDLLDLMAERGWCLDDGIPAADVTRDEITNRERK